MNEQQNINIPAKSSDKSKITLIIIALVILGLGGSYYYFNSNKKIEPAVNSEEVVNTISTQDAVGTSELATVKEFIIESSDFKFSLSEIKVKKGDMVKITLKNIKGYHDLVIDELKVAIPKLKTAGEIVTIEFVADKAGSFEYYCSIGNHRAMGMKGSLIIEE